MRIYNVDNNIFYNNLKEKEFILIHLYDVLKRLGVLYILIKKTLRLPYFKVVLAFFPLNGGFQHIKFLTKPVTVVGLSNF